MAPQWSFNADLTLLSNLLASVNLVSAFCVGRLLSWAYCSGTHGFRLSQREESSSEKG